MVDTKGAKTMDIETQEQIQELMFWQALFAEDRAKWHKAACSKKWTKKMVTTREEVIRSARILVKTAKGFGMDPEVVCKQAVGLLKATKQEWVV